MRRAGAGAGAGGSTSNVSVMLRGGPQLVRGDETLKTWRGRRGQVTMTNAFYHDKL
jgi:hypothetical protein